MAVADLTMTRGARLAAIGLLILTVIIGAGNLWATHDQVGTVRAVAATSARAAANAQRATDQEAVTIRRLNRQIHAECKFNTDLSGLPVTVNPATGKASLLGVEIISDVRQAWLAAGCPGRLPVPDPSFMRWAHYFHLPAGIAPKGTR